MFKKILPIAVAVIFIFMLAAPVDAGDAAHKLGRGLCNAATGWLELPVQIMKAVRDTGHLAALSSGLVKGVFYSIGRTLIGAVEAVTFLVPIPGGYKPIIEPEFVLEPISS